MNVNLKTTGAITGKTFKNLTNDNEKLGLLHGQIVQMGNDYEDMKRTREEAKKQLEAKFQDVYRKIQNTKDFVVSEGKRINDTLVAFQSKFEHQLKTIDKKFDAQNKAMVEDVNTRFNKVHQRCDQLELLIKEERDERLKQTDEQLRPIREHLITLDQLVETEKNTRVEREKEILQKISDEAYKISEELEKEKTERVLRVKELSDDTKYELKQQEKMTQDYFKKSKEEFIHIADNIEKEMDNRFEHQDNIVDNLSNMVGTFQDTLKVIGADV